MTKTGIWPESLKRRNKIGYISKKCSASLSTRKMQIKISLRFHLVPVRVADISRESDKKKDAAKYAGERKLFLIVGWLQIGPAPLKMNVDNPQNTKPKSTK